MLCNITQWLTATQTRETPQCTMSIIEESKFRLLLSLLLFSHKNHPEYTKTIEYTKTPAGALTRDSSSNSFHASEQRWNRSGFSRPDPTGKFQNHCRLTGRSTGFWPAQSTGFFTENFCSLFNVSYQKFSKGCMGEVLKFVTLRGGLRKKCKKNLRFLQKMT